MTDSRAALDIDRLPWLTEEHKPRGRRKLVWGSIIPWALVAVLVVAGLFYWLGMQSVTGADPFSASPNRSVATATLPEPTAEPTAAPEVKPSPVRDVEPVAEPAPVKISAPPVVRKTRAEAVRRRARKLVRARSFKRPVAVKKLAPARAIPRLQYWPAIESTGASGRMVRIGTFGTRHQAKKGWWAIVRHYPGLRRLKAVVAPVPSMRNGRTYYRLQFGTTSQAHSEILCQRMRMIAQSCMVVDLQGARGTRAG